jgi:2-polyprenyl-6-methoxyphenol hydroxylase-like FAD-dependent oxidoreductase
MVRGGKCAGASGEGRVPVETFDVVAGGGIVGIAAAVAAREAGARTLLIEKAPHERRGAGDGRHGLIFSGRQMKSGGPADNAARPPHPPPHRRRRSQLAGSRRRYETVFALRAPAGSVARGAQGHKWREDVGAWSVKRRA